MIAAYIGCVLIAAGSMVVLIEPFTSIRKLPEKQRDLTKALGVGLIALGTILSFWSVIKGFHEEHPTLAVLGLCFLAVVAVIVIVLPRFLSVQPDKPQNESDEEQADSNDDVGNHRKRPRAKGEESCDNQHPEHDVSH